MKKTQYVGFQIGVKKFKHFQFRLWGLRMMFYLPFGILEEYCRTRNDNFWEGRIFF